MGQCCSKHGDEENVKTKEFDRKQFSRNSITMQQQQYLQLYHKHCILEDYEISEEVLGSGLSGSVHLVKRKSDRKKFAMKILPDVPHSRREVELQLMASDHPHIVKIIDVYENKLRGNDCLFVVLEYMSGGVLFKKVTINRLTEREAARIMHDLGSAIEHIHSLNIAHRDIKPENVMYNNKNVLKLGDFGFAKQGAKDETKPLRTACYTNLYVPPEILRRVNYDKSCDMWSLGVLMYVLLCGYPPFYSQFDGLLTEEMKRKIKAGEYCFPSPDWDNISDEAKALVRKLLVPDPEERMTIQEFMLNPWISHYNKVSKRRLNTMMNLTEESMSELEDALKKELTAMRTDNAVRLKPLEKSRSAVLRRRRLTSTELQEKFANDKQIAGNEPEIIKEMNR